MKDKDLFLKALKDAFGSFTFYEEPHIYTYPDEDGTEVQVGISVTKLIEEYSQEFNKEKWAIIKAEQLGIEPEDVKKMWELDNRKSQIKGTHLHAYMENKWQGKKYFYPVDEIVKEFGYDFLEPIWRKVIPMMDRYYKKTKDRLIPLGLELVVGDKEYDVCGSIDFLCYSIKLGCVVVLDYKTNKKITYEGFKGQTMKPPLNHLQDCNYIHYSLQLSIYNHIIEKHTGWKLSPKRYLLWFNENNDDVEIIECLDLTKEAIEILERRKKG